MNHPITQIGIIGAGELGSALGQALTNAHAQVLYYDKDPTKTTSADLETIVRSCPLLLLCVPSWETRGVAKQIAHAGHPSEHRLVVTAAKGVEAKFTTMDEVLRDQLPRHYDVGVLYGPMIAEEIARGRDCYGALAVSATAWLASVRTLFTEAHIYTSVSGDVHGLAITATVKNMYAIAFGIIDGLHLGNNTKGKLMVAALNELRQLLIVLGGDPHTAYTVAGLGDMVATGFSEESFNYRVGKSLAEGIADEHIKSEGLVSLYELGRKVKLDNYPILATLEKITFRYASPQDLAAAIRTA